MSKTESKLNSVFKRFQKNTYEIPPDISKEKMSKRNDPKPKKNIFDQLQVNFPFKNTSGLCRLIRKMF